MPDSLTGQPQLAASLQATSSMYTDTKPPLKRAAAFYGMLPPALAASAWPYQYMAVTPAMLPAAAAPYTSVLPLPPSFAGIPAPPTTPPPSLAAAATAITSTTGVHYPTLLTQHTHTSQLPITHTGVHTSLIHAPTATPQPSNIIQNYTHDYNNHDYNSTAYSLHI